MDQDDDKLADEQKDTGVEQPSAPETDAPATNPAPETPNAQADQPADAAPGTKGDGSLTPPNNEANEQQPPAKDWTKEGPVLEKRYRDLMSHTDRQVNQWQQRMQTQERQLQEMATWKQDQEKRAHAAQLKPWSKAHPENQRFNGVLERAKVIEQQLRQVPTVDAQGQPIPPAQQEAMRNAIVSALSNDEQQQIREYRESLNNFQRDFFTDPHGTLLPMVEQLAEQKVQQALQKIEAQHSVQQDFADPQIAPLIKEYGDEFARALKEMPEKPYEYAKQMMMLFAENQKLKSGSQQMSSKVVMAEEQQRLAKTGAAITRDPGAPHKDPYMEAVAEAKKRGITSDSPRFAAILAKHER